jgi:cell division protein FtsI (penicillin-binding protein 3)
MDRRSVILTTIVLFCFGVLFLRLFDIMLLHHEKYANRASVQQTQELEIQKRRGIIYDRNRKEFAANVEQRSLYVDPARIDSVVKTASLLSDFTGIERTKLIEKIKSGKRFVWIKRKVDGDMAREIEKTNLQGIGFIPEPDRVYPRGKLASHLIGFVDIDNKGLAGIEKEYEKFLSSRGGKVLVATDARGNILFSGVEIESTGNSVVLTIDEVLQFIVEKALDEAMTRWKAKSASAMIMNPYTGEILAMANRPTFNPNTAGKYPDSFRKNSVIADVYEPGSTFKIVTAAAVLEEHLFTSRSTFDCSQGYIEVANKRIRDAHRHDILTLTEVIQKSSNVGTIMMAEKLGKEKLYHYAKEFGFGEKTGIDLPGEIPGWIREPGKWSGTSIGAIPIGQEVAVTSLQVLRAYAAIANGGYLVTPFTVSRIISPEGAVTYEKKSGHVRRIMSERTANQVREMLEMVTVEGGTAQEASIEGNTVAGKTGTAQIFDREKRRYSHERFMSSFVGFFPSNKPRLAMIVVISEPKGQTFGGLVAAPAFKEIAEQALAYLNVPRDDSSMQNVIHVSAQNEAKRYY